MPRRGPRRSARPAATRRWSGATRTATGSPRRPTGSPAWRGLAAGLFATACAAQPPAPSPVTEPAATRSATPADAGFDALVLEVRGLSDRGREDDALAALDRAAAAYDGVDGARVEILRGTVELRRGNLDTGAARIARAEAELDRLGATGLPRAEAVSAHGSLHWARKEFAAALEAWTRARAMATGAATPERRFAARMAYNRAHALSILGRHEEALRVASIAFAEEDAAGAPACPDLALTRGNIALFCERIGALDQAIAHYRAAIGACADVPRAGLVRVSLQLGLAGATSMLGKHDEALAIVRQVRQALHDDPDATLNHEFSAVLAEASALQRAGRFREAAALIEERTPTFRAHYGSPNARMVTLCAQHVWVLSDAGDRSGLTERIDACRREAEDLPDGPDVATLRFLDAKAAQLKSPPRCAEDTEPACAEPPGRDPMHHGASPASPDAKP